MNIVLVTGGFDPLHSGHIAYFESAKTLGDQLWVGVNSDAWLVKKKGKPFMPFLERTNIVKNLKMVDYVLGFDDDEIGSSNKCIEYILEKYPDYNLIVANGGDRNPSNIPEVVKYGNHPRVKFAWSVGGDDKKNSSSWILEEWKNPKTVRNWGWYRVIDDKKSYKVKELVIDPGKSLSMQRHYLRSEHWYVLKGECVLNTEYRGRPESVTLKELSNGYVIEKEVWHQAKNLTDYPCHILEVQYGEQCIEEDIERR